jgi:hypothetical protein
MHREHGEKQEKLRQREPQRTCETASAAVPNLGIGNKPGCD